MITTESILAVTCPVCGAGPRVPCMTGSRGKVRKLHHPRRIGRALDERNFWRWVDEQLRLSQNAGKSEQDLLDEIEIPGYTGRKARTVATAKVVQMPVRDFRKAAAGDDDEAA